MKQTVEPDAYSKPQIARCMQRFEQGDFSCKDESKAGRPLLCLRSALSQFLSKYPFTSAQIIEVHFEVARDSVKITLARELDLKKLSRRWLPHQLSDIQQKSRIEFSLDLLQILEDHRELQFEGIATRDESSFRYLIQSDSMFSSSRDAMTSSISADSSMKNTILTVFFASRRPLILDALPKGQKYNQDCFLLKATPELQSERSRFPRRKILVEFVAHMDD
jgi:hypothetical protein